jgi:osmotically inducible protein OsmC
MPRIERTANVKWEGNVARGAGHLTAGSSGAFTDLPLTLASRIGNPEGKTSPEELLAGAHAGCPFSTLLRKAGATVEITSVD